MMKIQRNKNEWVVFADLGTGAIFIDEDDDVNIKCYDEANDRYCAIVLNDGLMWSPDSYMRVKEVHPTLVIDKE